MLSQTMMSIPVTILSEIFKEVDQGLVICEPDKNRYYTIHIDQCSVIVRKSLRACKIDDNPETVLNLEIDIETDFTTDETCVYINGKLV